MTIKNRPHSNSGIDELEKLFAANIDDRQVLKILKSELEHRKSIRARHLYEQINDRLVAKTVSMVSAKNGNCPAVSIHQAGFVHFSTFCLAGRG